MWNRTENQIELVLVRHGATASNREHRYLGRTDEGLSTDGIGSLRNEKAAGSYPDIDYLFASPMRRCLESAGILYPDTEPFLIPEWREMDFGEFEGKNYVELKDDCRYQAWIDSNGLLPFPGGESREEFINRCERGFYRMLAGLTEEKKPLDTGKVTVGAIVHGGTIMSLMSRFCGGEYYDYQVENGKGYRCSVLGFDDTIRLEVTGML